MKEEEGIIHQGWGGLPTLPGLYLSTFQPSQRGFFRVHMFVEREWEPEPEFLNFYGISSTVLLDWFPKHFIFFIHSYYAFRTVDYLRSKEVLYEDFCASLKFENSGSGELHLLNVFVMSHFHWLLVPNSEYRS
jgi:hypothetical protein